MQEKEEEWPCIELTAPKLGILSQFTSSASEAVAHILIKELVEKVDKLLLLSSSQDDAFSTDQDLEWIMQVTNHSLTLPFIPNQCYETLRSAVRIYIAWSAALTTDSPRQFCPKQILLYPDKYFKKFLEAFRHIFQDKTTLSISDNHLVLSRQGTQIQTILTAIRHLTNHSKDEFKDEVWARCLLFLLNVNDQLITFGCCKSQESIGCLMARDLCQNLFDCWLKASLNECIPSPAYWTTFSSLSVRCGAQIQFIECWASSILHSTSLLLKHLFGQQLDVQENVFDDDNIFGQFSSTLISFPERISILKDVWLNLFILLGRPTKFIENALSLLAEASSQLSSNSLNFFVEQLKLSFFLIIFAFKKMVDLFFGDHILLDFNESEELHSQWLEASLVNNASNIKQDQRHTSDYQMMTVAANNNDNNTEMTAIQISGQVLAQQHVWFILKNNLFSDNQLIYDEKQQIHPTTKTKLSSSTLLNLFLDWLFEAAIFHINTSDTSINDSTKGDCGQALVSPLHPPASHKSLSSVGDSCTTTSSTSSSKSNNNVSNNTFSKRQSAPTHFQQQQQIISSGINNNTTITTTLRRSFATSISRSSNTQSSSMLSSSGGDPHQQHITTTYSSPTEFPSVDGVSSGRAAALCSLCKIVCAKYTNEQLRDDQLARFFALAHEALISNDRILLTSFIFSSADNLFKLALKGVQILLPNYLRAIELVHNDSLQILLHPSISQIEMRAACLRAIASILPWPSVFGWANIIGNQVSPSSVQPSSQKIKRQGSFSSSSNLLESSSRYADLREPIQRILICSLRQETDPSNVQFSLGLASIFCAEAAEPELKRSSMLKAWKNENKKVIESETTTETVEAPFSTSLVRSFISAICDNLCKPAWANETPCCLAAFDCLNSFCSLPRSVLFSNGELSTGSLIVTSLCRFIEQQLKKPPPLHSKDMHSTTSEQYKPASQRVHDAAQSLLHSLFSTEIPTKTTSSSFITRKIASSINELMLVKKFGLKLDKFEHFLLHQQNTLISLYEAQRIPTLSKGLPSVIAIFRTPFNAPWASLFRLMPKAPPRRKKQNVNDQQQQHLVKQQTNSDHSTNKTNSICDSEQQKQSSNLLSVQTKNTTNCSGSEVGGGNTSSVASNSSGVSSAPNISKHFKIPKEVFEPDCENDRKFPKLEPVPPHVLAIQSQLEQIQARLASGSGCPIGDRDTRNVWLNNSLGALLTKPPIPESPVSHCNSLRVFLYDLGLINRTSYLNELTPLDSSSFDIFYDSLYTTVDQHPVHLTETVSLFYVKEGQKSVEDILQNNIDLRQTSAEYCRLLSELGKALETRENNYKNGGTFSSNNTNKNEKRQTSSESFVFDGVDYCLNWKDSHVDISFITPTGRTATIATTGGSKASSVRRTATLRPSSIDSVQQFNINANNNINKYNNNIIGEYCIDKQSYNKEKNNNNEYYNNKPSIDSNIKINLNIKDKNKFKCEISKDEQQQIIDIKKDEKYYSTLLGDEYEFFKKRAMLIWAQSVDEINAMERDLIISGTEDQHQLDNLEEKDKEEPSALSSNCLSDPVPSSTTRSVTPLPLRSARFSTSKPLSLEKQRRLSLISAHNSSRGSAESGGSICCKNIAKIKAEDEEMMGAEQRIRASSSNSATPINVKKNAATAHRRTSIQSVRHRRYNLGKIDLNDLNNTNSPPLSPPPMSHGRRTSTVFREILLGNLRVEDVAFSDKASTTATAGSSTTHTPTNISPVDCESGSASFNQLETSSVASTSTVSNYFASENISSPTSTSKPQVPTVVKPPLQRNDSIASTSTTTSTFSYLKSLFFRRPSRGTSQNSQASSECGMPGRRKSSLAKVIDEELEDLREEDENEKKKSVVNKVGEKGELIKDVTTESFASSNGNNSRVKDAVDISPTYPPASSIPSNRTLSSTSIGNDSSAHSTAATATTNIEHSQQQPIQKTTNLQKSAKRSADLRIFIVWLERLEDMSTFPIAEMFPFTTNDINTLKQSATTINSSTTQTQQQAIDHLIFYIFPFERGLRRIQIDGVCTKQGRPGPLHNGTVVSTRALPLLLRQTVCNVARRKAVEIDNYQMTHLKRKQAIAEFGRRFATRQDYTEFVEHLLQDNSASFGTVFPP
uniref:RALGAPB_N domain-containing protein n=1 Tax=Meloidogyne hapla TaxID=6305 RepID=A0A1I8B2P5_MELHA